jgi:hypothetical protein
VPSWTGAVNWSDSLLARYGWETLRLVSDDVGIGLFQTTRRVRDILELRGRPA